jgi:hypothetical protein
VTVGEEKNLERIFLLDILFTGIRFRKPLGDALSKSLRKNAILDEFLVNLSKF